LDRIEKTILRNLIHDESYMRQVYPFLTAEYFAGVDQRIFNCVSKFIDQYNACPTKEALDIALQNSNLNENDFKDAALLVADLIPLETNREWLLTETEKFCKDKAVYNAILRSIEIIDGRDKKHNTEALPSILAEALGVSFDNHVGHDYLGDADSRFDFYHKVESRVPFDLDLFNKITGGGMPNKTLNVCLAGTGVGKSLFMCHVGAACLSMGKNVLYITLEMAEERIAERIDANLMNVTMADLKDIPKQMFASRVDKIKAKTEGRLIIKEYPTAGAHVGHFKALLNELSLKQSFHPDIIIIDYLNICTSARIKQGAGVNSYTYIKSIAEELRGLAVEHNVPILSATQTTRGGYANTDVDLTDTSESFGLPATVDFMFALISTEELEDLNQLLVKQLKNRYNDPASNRKFIIGVDRAKMKLYDVEASAQKGLSESGQDRDDKPLNTFGSSRTNRDFSKFKT
jgi:archaellum biogenesis ATPase FlaH